jgi:hypothetical protein
MRAHLAFALLATAVVCYAIPASAQLDASCVGSITINFDPPAMLVLPPTPAPHTTGIGGGTIAACVVGDAGPTTGTFTFSLEGDMTCTSTANFTGTVDIVWSDNTESHAELTTFVIDLGSVGGAAGLTATIVSGRFAGDDLRIVNVRDPKALLQCVLHGLSQATGTTSLTFTKPL